MLYLVVTLQTLATTHLKQTRQKLAQGDRGSETIEKIMWAGAVILAATGAIAIFRGYINNQLVNIR